MLDAVPLDFNGRLHCILAARCLDRGLYDYGPLAVIPPTTLDGVILVWHVMVHEPTGTTNTSSDFLLNYN